MIKYLTFGICLIAVWLLLAQDPQLMARQEATAIIIVDAACGEWLHVAQVTLVQWDMAKSVDGIRQARDIYESVPIVPSCTSIDAIRQADFSITYGLSSLMYALTTPSKVDNELALAHYHFKRAQATVAQIRIAP